MTKSKAKKPRKTAKRAQRKRKSDKPVYMPDVSRALMALLLR